mgnify:FL=1
MKHPIWIGLALVLAVIIYLSFVRPHEMLSPGNLIPAHSALQTDCFACHAPLRDAVHKAPKLACSTCHQPAGWKPATFDHNRFFALDKDHNTACTTCHLDGLYKRYTCYGCHEHQQAKIIAAHREEGMINIEKCARCHRRAEGEVEREGEGRED